MPTVQDLLVEAARHIGARYDNGAGRTASANVASPSSFDCSGYIKYLGLRTGAGDPGNVSDSQYQNALNAGLAISDMNTARHTPGVLLFKPGQGNNGHVAMVFNANGDTIEAHSGGVSIVKGGANKAYFTRAAMMPGVDYSQGTVPLATPPGQTIPNSSISPPGTNDVGSDPAYHLAVMASLLSGTKPEDIAAAAPAIGAVIGTDPTSTGSSTSTSSAISSTSRAQWAKDFLTAGGYPISTQNIQAVEAWQQAENTKAGNNPLATTQKMSGSSAFNQNGGFPVQNYTDYNQGIDATVHTVKQSNFKPISDALMAGNDPLAVGNAISQSQWGTGRGVLDVLHGQGM